MAEVLSPLSSPTSTINMLHSRPSSSDTYQNTGSVQQYQQHHQAQRVGSTPRSVYNAQSGYRGMSGTPVQPYAFQATPQLRQETRTTAGPSTQQQGARSGHRSSSSTSTVSSDMSAGRRSPGKDDLVNGAGGKVSFLNLSSSIPDLSLTNFDNSTPKPSPNRYRRTPQRIDSSSSPQKAAAAAAAAAAPASPVTPNPTGYRPRPLSMVGRTASDDMAVTKSSSTESPRRYRRRSFNSLDTSTLQAGSAGVEAQEMRPGSHGSSQSQGAHSTTIRPVSAHSRTASAESVGRGHGSAASAEKSSSAAAAAGQTSASKNPPRSASSNPSPLSQAPITGVSSPTEEQPRPTSRPTNSPAAQQLAALSDKELNKGMKSKLRRAFSFGSSAELRKAVAMENITPRNEAVEPDDGLDPEQREIARRQEAAGIGAGIYTGQGGFTGSNDNLSISSTASSASMMLRKMGKGMKKGGRSLKGLFRPKSVIGVPAADGPIQPSVAQVSMVTVEAERQKVNVNAHPAEHPGGGTGFPKLEKNSIDAVRPNINFDGRSSADRNDSLRKSIVGSDKDRQEVLNAVKKGILKRSGANSPVSTPDGRPNASQGTSHGDSPVSSMPTTPRDDRASRSMSSTTSDYFSGRGGVVHSRSMPPTPQAKANISFSPRIQFYDAWSSSDYDRRGDIATCNRLTPMLAQQIKEELNTFKMEMEVHELSKPHTHFF